MGKGDGGDFSWPAWRGFRQGPDCLPPALPWTGPWKMYVVRGSVRVSENRWQSPAPSSRDQYPLTQDQAWTAVVGLRSESLEKVGGLTLPVATY